MATYPHGAHWPALHELVDRVAERQRADFGQIASTVKPDGSLVTDCDRWSDATIAAGLEAILPGDGLLSEEGCTDAPTQRPNEKPLPPRRLQSLMDSLPQQPPDHKKSGADHEPHRVKRQRAPVRQQEL